MPYPPGNDHISHLKVAGSRWFSSTVGYVGVTRRVTKIPKFLAKFHSKSHTLWKLFAFTASWYICMYIYIYIYLWGWIGNGVSLLRSLRMDFGLWILVVNIQVWQRNLIETNLLLLGVIGWLLEVVQLHDQCEEWLEKSLRVHSLNEIK